MITDTTPRRMWHYGNLAGSSVTARCPDCASVGLVELDRKQAGYTVAAPCPMCKLGQLADARWGIGEKASARDDLPMEHRFWSTHRVRDHTWNGGLSALHRVCRSCTLAHGEPTLTPPDHTPERCLYDSAGRLKPGVEHPAVTSARRVRQLLGSMPGKTIRDAIGSAEYEACREGHA